VVGLPGLWGGVLYAAQQQEKTMNTEQMVWGLVLFVVGLIMGFNAGARREG
jgi:hypothetical protein